MWALGVLLYAVLTGGVPPLAQHLSAAPREGLALDVLQRGVSDCLGCGLAGCSLSLSARVRPACCASNSPFTIHEPFQIPNRLKASAVAKSWSGLRNLRRFVS